MLHINLYELVKSTKFKGLPIPLVKHFTAQILQGLNFLAQHSIIHCDLKPENILISDCFQGSLKIIDFGSSCHVKDRIYTYIQSRFYRSPEVILGMEYDMQIDMWSLGCVVAELVTGKPLFMGQDEQDQITKIIDVIGKPDKALIAKCSRRKIFFDSVGNPRNCLGTPTKSLKKLLGGDEKLTSFVEKCCDWNPRTRIVPADGLAHEFVVRPLPSLPDRKRSMES